MFFEQAQLCHRGRYRYRNRDRIAYIPILSIPIPNPIPTPRVWNAFQLGLTGYPHKRNQKRASSACRVEASAKPDAWPYATNRDCL